MKYLKRITKKNHLIFKIIENLPEYIILNPNLIKMFRNSYEFGNKEMFSIDSLVSIFEHFEALCWKSIKDNIPEDYKLVLSEESKKYVTEYFEANKDKEKLINVKNFTKSLRQLISRSIAGSREEADIKTDAQLKLYIGREDLWPKEFIGNDDFIGEIFNICKDDIIIGNCLDLYNLLDGDGILNNELNVNRNEMNRDDNQNNDNLDIGNDSDSGDDDGNDPEL